MFSFQFYMWRALSKQIILCPFLYFIRVLYKKAQILRKMVEVIKINFEICIIITKFGALIFSILIYYAHVQLEGYHG